MLDSKQFDPMQVSELASALATIELASGSDRKAKSFFKQSLISPTENSAAQAIWSVRHAPGSIARSDQERLENLEISRPFEMRTRSSFFRGHLEEALQYALLWLEDQPFSVRPAHAACYLASVLGYHYRATLIERAGLKANPNDWLLLNNLAFDLTNLGEMEAAESSLNQVEESGLDVGARVVLTATRGFLAYRSGEPEAGRSFYRVAIELALHHKLPEQLAIASIYFASEEIRGQGDHARKLYAMAWKYASAFDRPDVRALLERLEAEFVNGYSSSAQPLVTARSPQLELPR